MKRTGDHSWHKRVESPTDVTFFQHGPKFDCNKFSCERGSMPAKYMLAPLSGKILILIGGISFCGSKG